MRTLSTVKKRRWRRCVKRTWSLCGGASSVCSPSRMRTPGTQIRSGTRYATCIPIHTYIRTYVHTYIHTYVRTWYKVRIAIFTPYVHPLYTRYTCIYTTYTPYIHLTHTSKRQLNTLYTPYIHPIFALTQPIKQILRMHLRLQCHY